MNDGVHAGLGSSPFDVAKLPDAELAELCGKLLADVFIFADFSQPLSKCLSGCHSTHLLRTLYRRKQSAEQETDCTCSNKEQSCTAQYAELVPLSKSARGIDPLSERRALLFFLNCKKRSGAYFTTKEALPYGRA